MNNKTKNGKTGTRAQEDRHGNTIHGKNRSSASQRLSSLSKSEMGGESRKNKRRNKMKKIRRIKINGTVRYAVCNDKGEVQFFLNDEEMADIWDKSIEENVIIN